MEPHYYRTSCDSSHPDVVTTAIRRRSSSSADPAASPTQRPEADNMLLLDYQNVLIQNVLTERFSGFAPSYP